jgi:hypothetical protein
VAPALAEPFARHVHPYMTRYLSRSIEINLGLALYSSWRPQFFSENGVGEVESQASTALVQLPGVADFVCEFHGEAIRGLVVGDLHQAGFDNLWPSRLQLLQHCTGEFGRASLAMRLRT